MRSLGCLWNDLNDRQFDAKVKRTKNRLIASNKLSKSQIFAFMLINSIIGIFPLFFIPFKTVVISFCVVPLILAYPFMKRITWWPQLWLGITFNWGVIIGYNSLSDQLITIEMITMYLACILWTLAYDTVYGFQDIEDDKRIGLKSTSIKFNKHPKLFLLACYILSFKSFLFTYILIDANILIFAITTSLYILIFFKIYLIKLSSINQCHKFFIFNSYCGLIITLTFFLV